MVDRALLLMATGYLAGLGMLAYELQSTPSPLTPPAPATEPLPPLELPPVEINSIAIYDAIMERPLFSPERRPPEVGATANVASTTLEPAEEIDGFRLTAVLKGFGSTTALIEDKSGNTRTLQSGEKLGKWELEEIQDDRVVLLSGAKRRTLLVHRFDPVVVQKKAVRRPVPRRLARQPSRPAVAPAPAERKPPNSPKNP